MNEKEEFFNYLKAYSRPFATGSNSVLFTIEDKIYKFTIESSFTDAQNSMDKITQLQNQGVNTPNFYRVDNFYADSPQTITDLTFTLSNNNDIESFFQHFSARPDLLHKFQITGILQDKVIGESCFDESKRKSIKLIESNEKLFKDKTVPEKFTSHVPVLEELNSNLDYFLNIPLAHYKKFIEDAYLIIQSGLGIDNVFSNNFLYNSQSGFYFIDLNPSNQACSIYSTDIFDSTIDNICQLTSTKFQTYFSKEIAEKQLELADMIESILKSFDGEIGNLCKQYLTDPKSKFNKFKTIAIQSSQYYQNQP